MFGIPALQLLVEARVVFLPIVREILRELHGPHGRREDVHEHRNAAGGDFRGVGNADVV